MSRPGYGRPDARTRSAKSAGYPARSVFKLEEIDRRCQLFRAGQRVLDLGAAPGSWTLYASRRVGPGGRVFALDLSPLERLPHNAQSVVADIYEAELSGEQPADFVAQGPYDAVLSDMAPRTSGSRLADQARSQELCEQALRVADAVSAPGAHFVTKLFMNPDFAQLKQAISERYAKFRCVRPEATRGQSTEVFLVGLSRR